MKKLKKRKRDEGMYSLDLDLPLLDKEKTKNGVLKIAAVLLMVALNWSSLSAIKDTSSYFSDQENSPSSCQVSTLDFSLRSGQGNFSPESRVVSMNPGDSVARDVYIKKEGSMPFKYTASSSAAEGLCDSILYESLKLKVWYNWYSDEPGDPPNHLDNRNTELKYDGFLKNFDLRTLDPEDPDFQIPNTNEHFNNNFYGPGEHWLYFEIILPDNQASPSLENKSCQFNFDFKGWQVGFSGPEKGFSDEESITNTISTGSWSPEVNLIYPQGGEVWYLVPDNCSEISWCRNFCLSQGMDEECRYSIEWSASNWLGPDEELSVNIYFSNDSGQTWIDTLAAGTENDSLFKWKPPYNEKYITNNGRIKIEAHPQNYPALLGEDESEDFCPPMFDLEEIKNITKIQLVDPPVKEENHPPEGGSDSAGDSVSPQPDISDKNQTQSEEETPETSEESEEPDINENPSGESEEPIPAPGEETPETSEESEEPDINENPSGESEEPIPAPGEEKAGETEDASESVTEENPETPEVSTELEENDERKFQEPVTESGTAPEASEEGEDDNEKSDETE